MVASKVKAGERCQRCRACFCMIQQGISGVRPLLSALRGSLYVRPRNLLAGNVVPTRVTPTLARVWWVLVCVCVGVEGEEKKRRKFLHRANLSRGLGCYPRRVQQNG